MFVGCVYNKLDIIGFLTKYAEKEDLTKNINIADGKEILKWILEVIGDLEEIFEKGLVHKDIKPQNIVIDKENKVSLIDLSCSGYTKEWKSPRAPPFNVDSDIYSLVKVIEYCVLRIDRNKINNELVELLRDCLVKKNVYKLEMSTIHRPLK